MFTFQYEEIKGYMEDMKVILFFNFYFIKKILQLFLIRSGNLLKFPF